MAPPPQLEGEVLSLWRRDKEKNSEHDKAKELCYGIFHRERVTSGTAVTLATAGMVDSHEYHRTEGNLEEIKKSGGTPDANVGERAFLVQSLPQIEQLCKDYPDFKEGMSQPCAWGENATVSTLACTNVCVGDVFHVFGPDGTKRALELEVASPRRPCSNVDQRHGKRYNQSGVRAHTARTGLGGWFYRILQEGQVAEGDTLRCAQRVAVQLFACGGCRVHRRLCLSTCADRLSGSMPCLPTDLRLVSRPHPAWLLSRVAHLVYSEAVNGSYDIPRWPGGCRSHRPAAVAHTRSHAAATPATPQPVAVCRHREHSFDAFLPHARPLACLPTYLSVCLRICR